MYYYHYWYKCCQGNFHFTLNVYVFFDLSSQISVASSTTKSIPLALYFQVHPWNSKLNDGPNHLGFFLLDLNSWCQADLGQNFFRKNYFPKLEQFDLLISKLISLSPNQNAQIWEISFLRNQLTGDSALDIKLSGPWY